MHTCRTPRLAVAAALLSAGCAGGGPERSDPEPRLTAESVHGRHAAVRGRVDVRLAHSEREPVQVETVQVRHPLFETVAPLERRSTLPGDGVARIVPVPFGAPRCDTEDGQDAVVVLGVRTRSGVRDVQVPLTDREPGLARTHRMACAAAAVARAADVDLVPEPSDAGPAVRAVLRLQRTGPGGVVVTGLGGSVLLGVDAPDRTPLLELAAGDRSAQVEVGIRAARCDPHALVESKRSFTFPVHAALDGGEPALLELTVTGRERAVLQDLVNRTCGPAG